MRKVIYDGDMGGDDLWATLLLLGLIKEDKIDLLGITTCFGNVGLDQATRNILDFLDHVHAPDISVYTGSSKPINDVPPLLDGAFGSNGLSLASIPSSDRKPSGTDAVGWMAEQINAHDDITIICTGPATNLAHLVQSHPDCDREGVEILWFGGSLCPAGGRHLPVIEEDGNPRIGNITKYAEFNVINDVVAANIVADIEHAKVTYMPMDATQHMDIGLNKITGFLNAMKDAGKESLGVTLALMNHDVAALDEAKFVAKGCYVHDAQVIQYFDNPDLFLPRVPINSIQFINEEDKVRAFDAVKYGFDFSRLGHHGQMHCEKDDSGESNHFIVPGLTSFKKINDLSDVEIKAMDIMADTRWAHLTEQAKKACE